MNIKSIFSPAVSILLLCLIAPLASSAQSKQRLPLKPGRGEAGKAVAGRVKGAIVGAAFRDYFFTIPVGRGADISVTTDSGETVQFDVISPKGKKIFENETDILDDLPHKGTYIIRVHRLADATKKGGKSTFQLGIFMYI